MYKKKKIWTKNGEANEICAAPGSMMVTSTRRASDSTRLIQNSIESCGISNEETVNQGLVSDELDEVTEESTHVTMFGTQTQRLCSQVDTSLGITVTCSLMDKEFNKFSCSFCLQSFPSKYRLIMHVFLHIDGVQPPKYICKSCGEVFPSNVSLNKHLKISEANQALCGGINEKLHSGDSTFLESNQEVSIMKQAEKQCSSVETCKTSKSRFSDVCVAHTVPLTTERPHKCNVCGISFYRLSHLKSHVLLHLGMKPHKCEVCGKCFARSTHLKLHTLVHTGNRPHKCEVCGQSFSQLGSLRNHILLHTGQKPHKCDICGKSFTQLGSLKSHALVHTGKRPYKCEICDKSYLKLRHLQLHGLTHTGLKPHKCDICGKSFRLVGNLNRHASSHTAKKGSHKCELCGKYFTQLRQLKNHILIHTGTRPHECVTCGKGFNHLSALRNHILTHRRESSQM